MGFDPQKFFIGVIDFFSILMPGAMLVYLGNLEAPCLFGRQTVAINGTEGWMVFLFGSYLFGHFAFLLGAILDEIIYDPFRKATDPDKVARSGKGRPWLARALHPLAISHWFFGEHADRAIEQALIIKERILSDAPDSAINAYQWCKARLSIEHPPGLVAVQRFEADSKFFRSLVIVLALFAGVYAFECKSWLAVPCLVGLVLALWRYIELRFKGTQQAYWFIIALEGVASGPAKTAQR